MDVAPIHPSVGVAARTASIPRAGRPARWDHSRGVRSGNDPQGPSSRVRRSSRRCACGVALARKRQALVTPWLRFRRIQKDTPVKIFGRPHRGVARRDECARAPPPTSDKRMKAKQFSWQVLAMVLPGLEHAPIGRSACRASRANGHEKSPVEGPGSNAKNGVRCVGARQPIAATRWARRDTFRDAVLR